MLWDDAISHLHFWTSKRRHPDHPVVLYGVKHWSVRIPPWLAQHVMNVNISPPFLTILSRGQSTAVALKASVTQHERVNEVLTLLPRSQHRQAKVVAGARVRIVRVIRLVSCMASLYCVELGLLWWNWIQLTDSKTWMTNSLSPTYIVLLIPSDNLCNISNESFLSLRNNHQLHSESNIGRLTRKFVVVSLGQYR